jgi:hypothetical protein
MKNIAVEKHSGNYVALSVFRKPFMSNGTQNIQNSAKVAEGFDLRLWERLKIYKFLRPQHCFSSAFAFSKTPSVKLSLKITLRTLRHFLFHNLQHLQAVDLILVDLLYQLFKPVEFHFLPQVFFYIHGE